MIVEALSSFPSCKYDLESDGETKHDTVAYLLLDFAVLRHHPVRRSSPGLGQQYTDKNERRSSDGRAPKDFITVKIA